jgi:nucleoside-diphosphate-sugar epimerase
MKVLVTGGSGLVGRYVVDELAKSYAVEVLDLQPLHRTDVLCHRVDILDLPAVKTIVRGYDAIVHLAGIPHPLNEPADKVFRVNTLGTFHLLEAAAENGIRKFMFLSSESTLGFAFSTTRMWPEYFPIDEHHPLRPQDPYGLSKVAGELLCAGYARKTGMQTICLRPPWIWVPEEKALYRQLIAEYPRWSKNLWAYVHVFDVADAIRRVIERMVASPATLPLYDLFFICADQNWTGQESRALIAAYYPETRTIADHFAGDQSLISNAKAKRAFGFEARYTAQDIVS